MTTIPLEVSNLCKRLESHVRIVEQRPELSDVVRETCVSEVEMAEILMSARTKSSPLATHLMFKMALDRHLPAHVREFIYL